jgi:general secretion pathway protein I
LSRAANHRTSGATAGFTIIEALVALALVTVTIVAIGSVMASTARGTRQLENHVALVQAANNILWLDLPSRTDPVSPVLSGRTMDHNWRTEIEPVAVNLDGPAADSPWQPLRLRIEVQSPAGSVISLETVRLFKKQPQ